MASSKRLPEEFFIQDVLQVAPSLLGKYIVVKSPGGEIRKFMITETEAYRGTDDKACHASKGRTPRTEIMFHKGGHLYIYLIYGMYWMMNIVTGETDNPQAVLIRGVEKFNGPGKVTRLLGIDKSYNAENLNTSERIWIEDSGIVAEIKTSPRINIDYAGDYWKSLQWRYYI